MKSSLNGSSLRFEAAKFAPAAAALALLAFSMNARAQDSTPPVLPSPLCDSLQIPDGNSLTFHAYAIGVQIYRWNGTNWVFVAPSATLYADPGYHGQVAIHYAGPTWQSISGSKVVGMRLVACTPDMTAIPWLKLGALSSQGPGVFNGVSFIQRVNTVGGKAPSTAGTTVGQMANVPYSAEYYFYSPTD
jgi:hypothetical protein